ncbi:Clavaminate synthase-like protein [Neolentinus lepideus HHB14362 ss-1]|uniref:Clavaminate synthase-like protein n=1 Tax=Neolentinus lepideus HHB14362 ss-1 TaxID=1314782 RepID=A0A165QZ98_9AGAM|nr:Clavaminate synthase-like protein [Neolentinus lepideus HHB14362 ss-1]
MAESFMTSQEPPNYPGWTPLDAHLDRVSPSITPADFLSFYVLPRRPAVFTAHFADSLGRWTDLDYLNNKAGSVTVKVERLDTRTGGFGSGLPRVEMLFSEFLDKLRKGGEEGEMYLTTQYDDETEAASEDNLPDPFTCPPPCNVLKDDYPLRPGILESLVPHQVNLWLGRSRGSSHGSSHGDIDWTESRSSGLHHDHHDNLYVLLSGYKRFVLFPPSAHPYLAFYGSASGATVHANGAVAYEGESMGSDALSERERWGWETKRLQGVVNDLKKKRKKEKAAAKCGAKLKLKGIGRKKTALEVELETAEEALESAEDKYLDAIGEEGFAGEAVRDDFDALGDVLGVNDELRLNDEMDDASSVSETISASGSVASRTNGKGKGKAKEDNEITEPLSFSRMPTSVLHAKLALPSGSASPSSTEGGPSIHEDVDLKSLKPIVVYLKPGEMLYLPASWIHEVSSASSPSVTATSQKRSREDMSAGDIHMAFNYWFYPPDGTSSAKENGTGGIYKMQPLFDYLGTVIEERWKDSEQTGHSESASKRIKPS